MQFLRNFIGELPDDFRILSYTKKTAEIHAEIRVQVEKMGRPAGGKLAGVKKRPPRDGGSRRLVFVNARP